MLPIFYVKMVYLIKANQEEWFSGKILFNRLGKRYAMNFLTPLSKGWLILHIWPLKVDDLLEQLTLQNLDYGARSTIIAKNKC